MKGNTSVSLGAHFEGFINEQIAEGRYKNASEVIRDALRRLEDEEKKTKTLRDALQKGIDSGVIADFDPDEFLEQMKARRHAKRDIVTGEILETDIPARYIYR